MFAECNAKKPDKASSSNYIVSARVYVGIM